MNVNLIVNLVATLTLVEMMVTIGLGVRLRDVAGVATDWRLLGRALAANYIVVPAAAVTLLLLFHAPPMVAAGFLIVAACPGAPYGPPLTALARGNVVVSVGLMVILAGSSAILAPLLLGMLLPLLAGGDQPLRVDAAKMITTLALCQFVPLCVGLYLRGWHPALADKLRLPAGRMSTLLNLVLVGLIVATQFHVLVAVRPTAYVGMLALLAATVLVGWLLGGSVPQTRTAMMVTTAVRNAGVSLVVVMGSFPGTAAVTSATVYALFQTLVMALVALEWGRWIGTTSAGDDGHAMSA